MSRDNGPEHLCLPWLWPVCALSMAATDPLCAVGEHLVTEGLAAFGDVATFANEARKLDYELKPLWATKSEIVLDLPTARLRRFSSDLEAVPVLVDAPYAGHSSTIADFSEDQSLVRTLMAHGLTNLSVTDWKSATEAMKDFSIDTYLADLDRMVDALGGCVHLIGLCQGGWMAAAYAARFPHKVSSLVLAGSPIDADAGNGQVKDLAHTLPMAAYEQLVAAGGGRLLGRFMLAAWKGLDPASHYISKYADLFAHLHDQAYIDRAEQFARWYETPFDLPGVYYLEAVQWLFKENRLAKGTFVALGQTVSLHDIHVPVYMLAGEADDITPAAQVFAAADLVGTSVNSRSQLLVPGGHIGLFMGRKTLETAWPQIARWILNSHAKENNG